MLVWRKQTIKTVSSVHNQNKWHIIQHKNAESSASQLLQLQCYMYTDRSGRIVSCIRVVRHHQRIVIRLTNSTTRAESQHSVQQHTCTLIYNNIDSWLYIAISVNCGGSLTSHPYNSKNCQLFHNLVTYTQWITCYFGNVCTENDEYC